ncbi:MAG: aminoacyl-tRNA hydrolase [Aquabacterium sp.]|uniref:alternative ribosome rescue aminoacyl-tRNA hydrolase ArfB n=1 Tax=Aquabacterium sp. TaxID=1872578 RepID=UPI0025C0D04B|nr:alternative ribosome rescue aminoacyl-tRNA hydrolase ArfB [Aquabacterium sp.]MBI5924247.1 aminoacyl-tRNA hydrolase [Aquabacterium sp.]
MTAHLQPGEVDFTAIRAQGPGGQNVNKVSNAVHLRFNILASSLPADIKQKLLALPRSRVNKDGILIIKAQSSRSLEDNKAEALARLTTLIDEAAVVQVPRHPTKPTYGSRLKRLKGKAVRAEVKAARGRINTGDPT